MTRLIEIVPGVVFAEDVSSPSRGSGIRVATKGEQPISMELAAGVLLQDSAARISA